MPIREFKCRNCGDTFEELIFTRSEEAKVKCPRCGSKKVCMLFSVFGVAGTEKKVSSSSCGTCSASSCSTCKS